MDGLDVSALRDSEPPLHSQPQGFRSPDRWGHTTNYQTSLSGRVSSACTTPASISLSTYLTLESVCSPSTRNLARPPGHTIAHTCYGTLVSHVAALLCSSRLRHYDKRAVRAADGARGVKHGSEGGRTHRFFTRIDSVCAGDRGRGMIGARGGWGEISWSLLYVRTYTQLLA